MIESTLSTFLAGSKSTRLLKHGMTGQTLEIVPVSCVLNPCGRSSRCMAFNTPPDFGVAGVWLTAGVAMATSERITGPRTSSVSTRQADMGALPVISTVDGRECT